MILELPQVAAVCVIGVPDKKFGEAVTAIVELEGGSELEAEAVQQAVSDRIASFKKPRSVVFVDALPRLDSGMVDREEVKNTYA